MAVNSYIARAGDLRKRIQLQFRSIEQDENGQPIETWVPMFTAWAEINPITGREMMAAQQLQSASTHEITMRYRPELADPVAVANMRVLYLTRVFNIQVSLNQDERNRVVVLMAQEGVNNG